jgi:hypothetical protein
MPRYLAETLEEERWSSLLQIRAERRRDRLENWATRFPTHCPDYHTLRWGPNLTYWDALENGFVAKNEQRAMLLLTQICDEERVALYCATGLLPALGNFTKKTYLVTRGYGVDELDDGIIVRNWCIYTPNKSFPKTDGVIAVKNLIEGEEFKFLKNSNRHAAGRNDWLKRAVLRATVNPHNQAICPKEYRNEIRWPQF